MKRNTMICFQPVNSTSTEWLQSYQQRLNPQSISFPGQTGKEFFVCFLMKGDILEGS